jgi:hypothetical protein
MSRFSTLARFVLVALLVSFFIAAIWPAIVYAAGLAYFEGYGRLAVNFPQCMERATAAFKAQGIAPANADPQAVVGGDAANSAVVFCDASSQYFYVAVMGPTAAALGSKLVQLMQSGTTTDSTAPPAPAPAPAPSSGVSGTWQLYSNCKFSCPSIWQATIVLKQAADGTLTGSTTADCLKASVVNSVANPSQVKGTSFSLGLYPAGWVSNLQLTGAINGPQILGKVHHYGNDDCEFVMVRPGTPPPPLPGQGGPAAPGGFCANPKVLTIMDQWLAQATPIQPPCSHLRYEQWGRVVGQSCTAMVTASAKPDTSLDRCDWLWQLAPQENSSNLGTLKDYVDKNLK